jgi:uncharacterized protein
MFLSAGNIDATAKVGLLFIDFETPRKLRVQGLARIDDGTRRETAPGAVLMVRVEPVSIFINCPRYIHRYAKVETSKHVPQADGSAPLALWKRLEIMHDALPPRDRAAAKEEGFVSLDEARARADAGEG